MATESVSLINDFRTQFQDFFDGLTIGKKVFFFAAIGSILVGLSFFVFFANQETWVPLVSGLSTDDAARISQKLDELQIPYILQPGGRGILVHSQNVDKIRLNIASSGIQMGGVVGLEIFDKTDLSSTRFQQDVQYKRALEGELSRLITKIRSIKAAKISLAIPKESLFIDETKRPTAAVVLTLHGNNSLAQPTVTTILNLVSGAIPNMRIQDVRISDQDGKLLSKNSSGMDTSEIREKNFLYQHAVEQRLEHKLRGQLEKIVGADRVEVRITTKINFDQEEVQENVVDPDGSAVVSEEASSEKSTGSRSIPVGVPGVSSNSPEVRAGASEVANVSDVNRKSKVTNYANSNRQVKSKKASGTIERLSASVLLDGKYEYVRSEEGEIVGDPVYKSWSPQELEQISEIAKVSIGFNVQRGDSIQVKNIRFTKPLLEQQQLEISRRESTYEFVVNLAKALSVGFVMLATIFIVVRPMVAKLSAKPEDLDLLMGLPTTIGELEGEELEIPTEKEVGLPSRDKILAMARQDPIKTTSMIRAWLRDKK